ncbi:MAG: phosphoribosylglycinamide formyltransferase [Variovorax sp.]
MKQPIVILISGAGSNMSAIVRTARERRWDERLGAHVAAVLANRTDAPGLASAAEQGIATAVISHRAHASREAFDEALAKAVDAYQPALVALAGFMRILTPAFVEHYRGRLVNIHPSLLPAFPGLDTHRRAIEAGCRVAGATVHEVTAQLDCGAILAQAAVPIVPGEGPEALAARVLTQEHRIYPDALETWLTARLAQNPSF